MPNRTKVRTPFSISGNLNAKKYLFAVVIIVMGNETAPHQRNTRVNITGVLNETVVKKE